MNGGHVRIQKAVTVFQGSIQIFSGKERGKPQKPQSGWRQSLSS
jgi:hypothetical protein